MQQNFRESVERIENFVLYYDNRFKGIDFRVEKPRSAENAKFSDLKVVGLNLKISIYYIILLLLL